MSMSTYVKGIRDLDDRFAKMMNIKKACDGAKVGYPDEVRQYFKHPGESEEYLRSEMKEMDIKDATETEQDSESASDHITVDISKLPSDCKKIRFTNSW